MLLSSLRRWLAVPWAEKMQLAPATDWRAAHRVRVQHREEARRTCRCCGGMNGRQPEADGVRRAFLHRRKHDARGRPREHRRNGARPLRFLSGTNIAALSVPDDAAQPVVVDSERLLLDEFHGAEASLNLHRQGIDRRPRNMPVWYALWASAPQLDGHPRVGRAQLFPDVAGRRGGADTSLPYLNCSGVVFIA